MPIPFDPTRKDFPDIAKMQRPNGEIQIIWNPNTGAFGHKMIGMNNIEAIGCCVWYILETWIVGSGRQETNKVKIATPADAPPEPRH